MKTVVVLQSNYIPWKGYFDLINDADIFVFYDDVQYTKHDWRNRNKIKTSRGDSWLSIPVGTDANRLIHEVQLNDSSWQASHFSRLRQSYISSPFYADFIGLLEDIYLNREWQNLSELNQSTIRRISSEVLGIQTEFRDSRDYVLSGQKQDRLVDLIEKVGGTRYISGPAAQAYIEPERFAEAGVELVWKDYSGYPPYDQVHPPFSHGVTILDLLFHVGQSASEFIWGWRDAERRNW
jgi:hypothetical protein